MRLLLAIGLGVVLGSTTLAYAEAGAPGNRALVARAERWRARGNATRAITLLRRAQARDPSDFALALELVSWLLPEPGARLSRNVPALEMQAAEVVRIVDGLPSAPPEHQTTLRSLFLWRAWAQAWLSDFAGATSALRDRGSHGDEEVARLLRAVAALAVQRENLPAADQALRAARQLLPDDSELSADLAAVLMAQGRAHESLTLWEERFRAHPEDLAARRDLAAALLASGRANDAETLLEAERAACAVAPGCSVEIARSALAAGHTDAAITQLATMHSSLEALFLLADAYRRQSAWERARETYQRILALKPGDLRARENLRALAPEAGEMPPH